MVFKMIKIITSSKFRWAMVIFWLIFIFSMSHLDVAKSWLLTGRVMVAIENTALNSEIKTDEMTKSEEIQYYSKSEQNMILLRKTAHVLEFLGLSISLAYALITNFKVNKAFIIAFVLSLIYAIFDEAHQLLVPGRRANLMDVGIDTVGILLGLIIFKSLHYWITAKKGKFIYEN